MATASDRKDDLARVSRIEQNNQKGALGMKAVKRGPAYGSGLKNYGKGTKGITGRTGN
jgi:Translation machinery associated TMA7